MSATLLEQGLEIMLFGMGTVAAFLTLLVIAMTAMSWVLMRLYPERPPENRTVAAGAAPEDTELHAVIAAALHRHRQLRQSRR
jgi:oxaloacetate decarboxylase gamma subunit